ncbi:MAG TPA: acyl-CoA reductase [Flavobacteriaceae bacterium]|nr:acyl-CoA reductase [Flavobacteriaceae bacterium]
MNLNNRKQAFIKLGKFLKEYTSSTPNFSKPEKEKVQLLDETISNAIVHNGWFTKPDIHFSLKQWADQLTSSNLDNWLQPYSFKEETPKTVAIIMAGNVPLVGFHDFLSVLISGNKALVKQSSKDKHLLPFIADFLTQENSDFANRIEFTDERLTDYDAVIATGSNNTARYFEYYFSDKPHIIRRNRNSVAVLTGDETQKELELLGEDIFRYYGLGCRNISKIFIPKNYDFDNFFRAIYKWNPIINSHKYANNYDYNKAVYLMSEFKIIENGFFILKEDSSYASPIACLFYETYQDLENLTKKLKRDSALIQCVVSSNTLPIETLDFGQTQRPKLTDYADGVDILQFLSK